MGLWQKFKTIFVTRDMKGVPQTKGRLRFPSEVSVGLQFAGGWRCPTLSNFQ